MHGGNHSHDHACARAQARFSPAFAIGIGLNAALVVLQVAYGLIGNSVALLADAGHNFSDVVGLLLAFIASAASRRAPSLRYTYGLRSTSILAALANAIVLLIAVGAIALESGRRLGAAEPVSGNIVMAVAAFGIVINGGTALLFLRGRRGDLNIRAAFLHMAADAGVSLGVLLSGLVILMTGWLWFDPLVSLIISVIIVWGTIGLLREAVKLALDAVPTGIDPVEVREYLEELPGVARIHDLHIWPMSTTETALTCHLVMPRGHPGDAFLVEAAHSLRTRFGIQHATLQIECDDAGVCALAPDHVV